MISLNQLKIMRRRISLQKHKRPPHGEKHDIIKKVVGDFSLKTGKELATLSTKTDAF